MECSGRNRKGVRLQGGSGDRKRKPGEERLDAERGWENAHLDLTSWRRESHLGGERKTILIRHMVRFREGLARANISLFPLLQTVSLTFTEPPNFWCVPLLNARLLLIVYKWLSIRPLSDYCFPGKFLTVRISPSLPVENLFTRYGAVSL